MIDLWRRCDLTRPWNDPDLDIDRKVRRDPDGFLVGTVDDVVVATVMAGYDGHRGWVNYLAVDPANRGAGLGAAMDFDAVHEDVRRRGGGHRAASLRAPGVALKATPRQTTRGPAGNRRDRASGRSIWGAAQKSSWK